MKHNIKEIIKSKLMELLNEDAAAASFSSEAPSSVPTTTTGPTAPASSTSPTAINKTVTSQPTQSILPYDKITFLTIKYIEGGYFNPAQGSKGMGISGETMFGMDRKNGLSFTNSAAGRQFWSLIDQDKKVNPNRWKYLYLLNDNPKLKNQLISLITNSWLIPNYKRLAKAYLTKDASNIVESNPKLKYHMTYAVWNGDGWFKRFAKPLNEAVSQGTTDPQALLDIAMNSRINSGNKYISKSGRKIRDVILPQVG